MCVSRVVSAATNVFLTTHWVWVLIVVSIVCGIAMRCVEDQLQILATAFLGAYGVQISLFGIITLQGKLAYDSWVPQVMIVIFFALGVFIQYKIQRPKSAGGDK